MERDRRLHIIAVICAIAFAALGLWLLFAWAMDML
jgi:cytochrome b subunit of formate dehydrogenase